MHGMESGSPPGAAALTLHRKPHLNLGTPSPAAALADVEPLVGEPYVGDQQGPAVLRHHHAVPCA